MIFCNNNNNNKSHASLFLKIKGWGTKNTKVTVGNLYLKKYWFIYFQVEYLHDCKLRFCLNNISSHWLIP